MMYLLVLVALCLCIFFKILNVKSTPEKSIFYCANDKFLQEILKQSKKLSEPYTPTRLWGYSGHVQTLVQGIISRICCPLVNGERHFIKAADGATVSYDLYQPIDKHPWNDDVTLAVAPGICNSSESVYIRRVVYHAQFSGYRVAVLNHVGTLKCVPVTSPRIFCYGNTRDYDGMMSDLDSKYPGTKIICIGFSMGGNLVTKYLGETKRPVNVIAGISACQGYNAKAVIHYMLQWEGFRRLYLFAMTENMRAIFRRWQKILFTEDVKREKGINERAVWAAATMVELDEEYTRKVNGFKTVEALYQNISCDTYWEGVDVPIVFLNALDDPILPPPLLERVKAITRRKKNFLYIEQKYGGHLGFYEGGFIYPNTLSWLDRVVIELSNGLYAYATGFLGKKNFKEEDHTNERMDLDNDTRHNFGGSLTDGKKYGGYESSEGKVEDEFLSSDNESDNLDEDIFFSADLLPSRPKYVCRKRLLSYSSGNASSKANI